MLDATYPFVLPPLPYPYDALEPYIDAETMHYHYDKHFGGYIDNLNKALEPYPFLQGLTLEQLLAANRMLPAAAYTAIMHNGGGVYNHAIYFSRLCPPGQGGGRRPAGKLLDEISVTFGSFDKFKQELSDHAKNVFGSGWSSLVITREGSLRIVDLFNQQTVAGTGALGRVPDHIDPARPSGKSA